MNDGGPTFEGGPAAVPWDQGEIDLARLIFHIPELAAVVAPILAATTSADARMVALNAAVRDAASKREILDRLLAAGISPHDANTLAKLTCERELLDQPDRAPFIAQAVALRRAEAAALEAAAAKDFSALQKAFRVREAVLAAREEAAETLPIIDLAALDGVPTPPFEWFLTELLHLRDVGLLTGHGAAGKTQLLLQLAGAGVLGRGWLTHMVAEPGPALIVCCEDDRVGLHRRLEAVARLYEANFTDLAKAGLVVMSFAGKDAIMAEPDRAGILRPTPLFARISAAAGDLRPRFIGLDNAADVYAGDENVRRMVRQFITMLRGLAIETAAHVLLTLHPSLTGMNTGTGMSGNTAWFNSVRAQLYLKPAQTEGGGEHPELRELEAKKNQHGRLASTTTLHWQDGVFVVEGSQIGFHKAAAEQSVDTLFLTILKRLAAQGRRVSHKPGPTYAPTVFAAEPDARGTTTKGFAAAMVRLFSDARIHVETYGSPSHERSRLQPGAADDKAG